MKLTAKVRLKPTTEQAELLEQTLIRTNEAANYISEIAWQSKVFNKYGLQQAVYYEIKEGFDLSAQVVIRCLSKVADAYKKDKKTKRTFKPLGGIAYDSRILKYNLDKKQVSIWTLNGREKIDFVAHGKHFDLLSHQRGESDLIKIGGKWFLFATCDIDDPDEIDPTSALGIDLGIVQIASDSDGQSFSGSQVTSVRKRRLRQRKRLQSKGTKSSKRVLKRIKRKESRFAKDVNHRISKAIVDKAKRTNRAIGLEDLKGIRDRVRARKSQRYRLHSWSFHDLIEKIKYKAKLAGVPVVFVDPRNTSKTCSNCGHCDRSNRKSQSEFNCVSCGYVANADYNASKNISILAWGAINHPNGGASGLSLAQFIATSKLPTLVGT